ncbi:MAG: DNA cytosine methyltransferase, partial [Oscillospiraceae bacterium]
LAINHDPDAILMHRTNHPHTEHLQASVWDIDPREVCRGRPVGLAWFSPDCKHFSKAKGGKPVEKKIRGLAWIVLRWAGTVSPRVIILENVEEFQTWGPVRKGKPIKSKQGQTFQKWKKQLSDLGYEIEHRELVAADYGAPTIRKRFVLVARLDGKPIAWPEPTHNRNGTDGKKPWRSAAEIIDWSLPCPSIFSSKAEIKEQYGLTAVRPLADNTMRRIIRGVDKFTIKSGKPFIVPIGYGERNGQAPRIHSIDAPLPTTVSGVKHYSCEPIVTAFTATNNSNAVGANGDEPVNTIRTGGGGGQLLISASVIQYHGEQSENVRGQPLRDPLMVVDASNRYGLTAASLTEYYGGADHGQSLHAPQHTSTSHDRQALTLAHIAEFKGADIGQSATAPLRTITTSAGEFGAVKTLIVKYSEGTELKNWSKVR